MLDGNGLDYPAFCIIGLVVAAVGVLALEGWQGISKWLK